jgi:hypothetical protein
VVDGLASYLSVTQSDRALVERLFIEVMIQAEWCKGMMLIQKGSRGSMTNEGMRKIIRQWSDPEEWGAANYEDRLLLAMRIQFGSHA